MNMRPVLLLVFTGVVLLQIAAQPSHQLKPAKELPKDLAEPIAEKINPNGYAISGPSDIIGTIWLAKEIEVKPDFQQTLSVKYPFKQGQLIGVLQVEKDASMSDFRGQELKAGVYTLRYGQQPEDGNHIGTSELADFLLAIPAGKDAKPAPLTDSDQLAEQSASAAGSNHPAIFSLLPPEKPDQAKLTHDEGREFWIFETTADGKENDKAVKVPLKMVVIGESEA